MARTASGQEVLEQAKASVAKARTADELRQAQAVLLPLAFGLTLEQTAEAIGVSKGWACRLRRRFIRQGGLRNEPRPTRGGRRRENMTPEEETAFLAPFFEKAAAGGILVVSEIKQALDARLGRQVALASVYPPASPRLAQDRARQAARPDRRPSPGGLEKTFPSSSWK